MDSSDDASSASLLPKARNKSRGGSSIACTSASKKKRRGDRSSFDKDEDDSYNGNEKDDKERDYIPVTNQAVNDLMEGKDIGDLAAIIASHKKAFMERASPPGKEKYYLNAKSKSAFIPSCRQKSELDYIIYVVSNWQVGVQIRSMTPGYERDSLLHFCCQHMKGNKYIHQYHLEEVFPPGNLEPRTVVKRMVENEEGKMVVSGIMTCRENVFEAIDNWHWGNGHLGLERTWMYCKNTYWNVNQEHVRIYLKMCLICMKNNPVTRNFNGSCKPIFSKSFCDRFQLDIIFFWALRKHDPFGVLMRWVLTIKDHATGLIYLCALPRKYPDLVAYKLQEIFGVIIILKFSIPMMARSSLPS